MEPVLGGSRHICGFWATFNVSSLESNGLLPIEDRQDFDDLVYILDSDFREHMGNDDWMSNHAELLFFSYPQPNRSHEERVVTVHRYLNQIPNPRTRYNESFFDEFDFLFPLL